MVGKFENDFMGGKKKSSQTCRFSLLTVLISGGFENLCENGVNIDLVKLWRPHTTWAPKR